MDRDERIKRLSYECSDSIWKEEESMDTRRLGKRVDQRLKSKSGAFATFLSFAYAEYVAYVRSPDGRGKGMPVDIKSVEVWKAMVIWSESNANDKPVSVAAFRLALDAASMGCLETDCRSMSVFNTDTGTKIF